MGELKPTGPPLSLLEARSYVVPPEARRILSPQDIARLCVVPLSGESADGVITVALDPAAPDTVERMIRAHLGVRRVEVRPAPREAIEALLEVQFAPYWKERGWQFPGLPPLLTVPVASVVEQVSAAAEPGSPGGTLAADQGTGRVVVHPVVLFAEAEEEKKKALALLFTGSGLEARFAGSLEELSRECTLSPPAQVVVRRGAAVEVEDVARVLRKAPGQIELRALRSYGHIFSEKGNDERIPDFLFDLVRFFTGVVTAQSAPGGRGAEARARVAESVARSLGLRPPDIEAARLAALFVSVEAALSKPGAPVSGVAHDGLAQLLDPARAPVPIRAALEGRRERFDGTGPRGLAGEAISPAGRVLAAVEHFQEAQARGLGGPVLEAELRAHAGNALDPRTVEAVLRSERAERLLDSLGTDREKVLIVDADPISSSLLQMRLSNSDLDVEVFADGEGALSRAARGGVDLVISEVGVPRIDGLTLLLRLRRLEATRELPFIFVTDRTDRASTVKALELGADDYFTKPADLELLAAKVKGLIRKSRSRRTSRPADDSVSGSLSRLDLVDLLQVLAASRRTVRLEVEAGSGRAGELSLDTGKLVDARAGALRGVDAFFEVITWPHGRFVLRAAAQTAERTIDVPLEALLLEGCRLRDENARGQVVRGVAER